VALSENLTAEPETAPASSDLPYAVNTTDVVTFLEEEMYIPETGAPIELHPTQRDVLRAMFATNDDGTFKYHTMVYSAIKKSAKTTIGAGIALWQAHRIPNGEIYIIGNDLKQADSRMAQALRYCVAHNPKFREHVQSTPSQYKFTLPNGTKIEAIPVDPKGEAGMNPTGLFWTEAWGAKGAKAELLWTEAQLSPTPGRAGHTFRFVESYAGFVGESPVLEPLYRHIVEDGAPRPELADEFHVAPGGRMCAYWNTHPILPWQTDEYYADQAAVLTELEFRRIHRNEWVASTDAFVPIEWWDACKVSLPDMASGQLTIVALDAAVSGDCFGIAVVSKLADMLQVRYARQWTPPPGGKIVFSNPHDKDDMTTPEGVVRQLAKQFPVAEFCYDEYQLHDFCSRLRKTGVGHFRAFGQGQDRLIADKQLYDVIKERRIQWDARSPGMDDMRTHIQNSNQKAENERLRIVKRSDEGRPIDLTVCLSMASARALYLNIG